MASASGNTNPSKKRNTFFSQLLSSKNLSIFRNKTSTPATNSINVSKEGQHYKSQINLNTQQTPVPMCIGRGWLKKRLKRPISLDLDLVKTFSQQSSINNDGQLVEEHRQPLNDMGNSIEKITEKAEILVAKQIVDMPINQPGKYSFKQQKRSPRECPCLYS